MFGAVRQHAGADVTASVRMPAAGIRSNLSRLCASLNKEKGQTLVEFAFVLPLLLVFMLFVIDFGIALDRREVIQHAVREGARRGAVGDSVAQIMEETHDQSKGALANDISHIPVCYVDKTGNGRVGDKGDNVRVSGNYSYKFMVSLGGIGAPDIDMTPSAESRLEMDVPGANPCT
jgi:Flp pilus assembly protein TadG